MPSAVVPSVPVTSWRAVELGGLDLLHGTFTTHQFSRHSHETYSIGLLSQGAITFECRGTTYVQRPGQIGLINPDEAHNGQAVGAEGWTYRNLYPTTGMMLSAFTGAGREAQPVQLPLVMDDPPLLAALVRAHVAFESPESSLTRESLLGYALTHLVRRHGRQAPTLPVLGREERALEQVRQLLEDDLARNVSLQTLAELTGLNSFTLLRAFRRTYGLPPHAYQVQVRLRRAKTLLRQGLGLAEVALNSGFADQSHLGRHFRRAYGITPEQYRRGLSRTF